MRELYIYPGRKIISMEKYQVRIRMDKGDKYERWTNNRGNNSVSLKTTRTEPRVTETQREIKSETDGGREREREREVEGRINRCRRFCPFREAGEEGTWYSWSARVIHVSKCSVAAVTKFAVSLVSSGFSRRHHLIGKSRLSAARLMSIAQSCRLINQWISHLEQSLVPSRSLYLSSSSSPSSASFSSSSCSSSSLYMSVISKGKCLLEVRIIAGES